MEPKNNTVNPFLSNVGPKVLSIPYMAAAV